MIFKMIANAEEWYGGIKIFSYVIKWKLDLILPILTAECNLSNLREQIVLLSFFSPEVGRLEKSIKWCF